LEPGSCNIGIAPPVTCGICPFQRFAISYCTSVFVMLFDSNSLARACASASAVIALARPAALMLSPCAWNVFFCSVVRPLQYLQ
jgi:hypothetical protein